MALKESNKNRKKDRFVFVEEPVIEEPEIVKNYFGYVFWIIIVIALITPFII